MVNLLGENKKAYLKLTYLSLKLWINFDIISYLGSRLSQVFSDLYVKNIKKIVCKKKAHSNGRKEIEYYHYTLT